jgi:hypothetical protein
MRSRSGNRKSTLASSSGPFIAHTPMLPSGCPSIMPS